MPAPSANGKATYRALPTLEINGQSAPQNLLDDLVQIVVEESLHLPGMFTLVIQNDYHAGRSQDQPWRYKDLLQIGKTVKIGFSTSTTEAKEFADEKRGVLIEGEITGIETHFSERAQAPVIVRGYDTCHRLHRGQHNRSFQNMTDSDIVKKIAAEVGIPTGEIEASGAPHEYVFQTNQSNMEFLRDRAARLGFELFNQDGKLHFRKPKANAEVQLEWLRELHSFRTRVTSAEQVQAVEVRAWDYTEKRPIVATAKTERILTETQNGKGSATSTQFNGKPPTPTRMIVDQPIDTPKQADTMAQAVLDEISGQFIYADARAEGNTALRPGRVVKLDGMGQHSGKYYITETRHLYHERVYTTEFSVRGSRSGNLLTTIAQSNPLKPGQTPIVGIVTDNKDPKGWGRVKVKFPTLTEEHTSFWARVVSLGAANRRGFDCLPEINDEVLVAFEHGDIHRPYVIGGVWNGKDAPPESVNESVQNGKVRLRTMKTRTGHKLQFIEEPKGSSMAGIWLETAGGHKVYLNDTAMMIEIQTTGGHKLILNDSTGTIQVSAIANINMNAKGAIQTTTMGAMSNQAAAITNTATGAVSTTAGAALNLQAGGAASCTAGAAINLSAGAAITLSAAGAIALTGSAITLTGGSVTIVTPTKVIPF